MSTSTSYRSQEQEIPPQTGDGAEADSPLALDGPGWKESVRRAAKEFKRDRASTTAAGMAFYWFLAVFPSLLVVVGVLGLVNAGRTATDTITEVVRAALPGDAAKVLTDAVARAGSQSDGAAVLATLVGLGVAVWGASAGFVALQIGLDVAYDVEEDRKFLKARVVALLLLAVTVVLGGLATAMVVFGQPIGEAINDNFPLGGAFVLVWTAVRWALAVGALLVLFAAYYYVAPNRESPRWAWVSPGGVLAAAIWLAASVGFSFYVSSFGSYAETYGSLAGVVVLLLWLFLTAIAVMAGGELNAELERRSAMLAGEVPRGGARTAVPASSEGSPDAAREWARRRREVRENGGA